MWPVWNALPVSDAMTASSAPCSQHHPPHLPELRNAAIQHEFRRLEDYICWTQPLFKQVDYDQFEPGGKYGSTHRSIQLGAINLTHSQYNSGLRIGSTMEGHVLFTFNRSGRVVFEADHQRFAPPAGGGILMVTPTQGHYIRGKGGGILLTTTPATLVNTALAMQGPLAAKCLGQRLKEPLSYFAYGSAAKPSLSRSLLQSLQLVDSLLTPWGTVPAVLRLDDLICRQLVLMLCPELSVDETDAVTGSASTGFELMLEWASSRMTEPLSLSELEARSGYSRRALQRAFQQRFGCGPMQWLRRRRLELALEQLSRADGADSVAAIARRCGYVSAANFSRDFIRVYGRRPSEILVANQQQPDR
jgi:AraC-like DNA-binding protein